MSLHRSKAVVIGLLEIGGVNEWVVTQKLGAYNSNIASNMAQSLSSKGISKYLARLFLHSIHQKEMNLFFCFNWTKLSNIKNFNSTQFHN